MANITINSKRMYSDFDLNFVRHPVRKDINLLKDEKSVINSIKNLVLINYYERLFNPSIGCNVKKLLFENIDDITGIQIQQEIIDTINNFEPRVNITNVLVSPAPDDNGYNITISFYVKSISNPITISFFLERVR